MTHRIPKMLALLFGLSIAGCQSGPHEPFIVTDLEFSATMRWKPDAKFVDSPEGKSCSGIEIENLKLEDLDIPLTSNKVSSECLVSTKDYGQIQFTGHVGGGTAVWERPFMVTASQAEQFRELVNKNK